MRISCCVSVFFFKQKTAYELRISDWSSDVGSSDLIAEAVDIPQILYNVPGRTSCDMQAETVIRLSTVPNIIGIKEATGDLSRAKAILEGVSDDFIVLSGDDPTAVELILLGGKGNISVTANVAPREMADLCEDALTGDDETARATNEQPMPMHKQRKSDE